MRTAETHYQAGHAPRGALRVFALIAEQHLAAGQPVPTQIAVTLMAPPSKAHPDLTADVYANHGRWVVDCPFCASAQLASESDPYFLCVECVNAPILGELVRLAWPSKKKRADIEHALEGRPLEHQNWLLHETVNDLIAENVEHQGLA